MRSTLRHLPRTALALIAGLVLAGCAAVYSPGPMGEEPVTVDPAEWDGLWTAPGIGMVIETVDAEAGELDVLLIDGTSTRRSRVLLRRSGGWLFASTDDIDDTADDADGPSGSADAPPGSEVATGDQPGGGTADAGETPPLAVETSRPWIFFRVVRRDATLVLWAPHPERFRRAVARGHLPGRVAEEEDGDPVYLGELTAEHYRLITESEQGVLMDWDEPIALVRVTGQQPGPP